MTEEHTEACVLPGSLGAGLQEGVSKESDRPVDWLMNPGIIFLSEVAYLPRQGLAPVHQILLAHNTQRTAMSHRDRVNVLPPAGGSKELKTKGHHETGQTRK